MINTAAGIYTGQTVRIPLHDATIGDIRQWLDQVTEHGGPDGADVYYDPRLHALTCEWAPGAGVAATTHANVATAREASEAAIRTMSARGDRP
jgi:hypothetical protein